MTVSLRHPLIMVMLGLFWLWGCTPSSSAILSTPSQDSETAMASPSVAQNEGDQGFDGQHLPIVAQVQLGSRLLNLEVTRTEQEQAMGLMFRRQLEDDRGMLFEFLPPRPVSFWMKNMVIPLDMIFVNGGKIVAIAAQVPPCTQAVCPTYGPDAAVDQVIEVRSGLAAELGLKPGDLAQVQWLKPEQQKQTNP